MPGLFIEPSRSRERFSSLELAATVSSNDRSLAKLMERSAVARGADGTSIQSYDTGRPTDEDGFCAWHVWWAPPSLWRDDLTWPGGQTTVSVVRDGAAFVYISMLRVMYSSEPAARDSHWETERAPTGIVVLPTVANRLAAFPLIRPPLPASEWAFTTVAQEEVHDGRMTRRVRATRRTDTATGDREPSGYWPGVDEYECLVDDALHILLRFTGLANGGPVAGISASRVRVDAPLPVDVFAFAPPAGTRVAHILRTM